jgi:hypothetical protein
MYLKQDHDLLLEQAIRYLQVGYFEGVVRCCSEFERFFPGEKESVIHIVFLAKAYMPGQLVDSDYLNNAKRILAALTGGQGLAEYVIMLLRSGKGTKDARIFDAIIATAKEQHGVIVTWHPTALLEMAEYALLKFNDKPRAIALVNIVIGLLPVFVSVKDVCLLAKLLIGTEAPIALWADWCTVFIFHAKFAITRVDLLEKDEDYNALLWAEEQVRLLTPALHEVFSTGPVGLVSLLKMSAPYFDAAKIVDILNEHFPGTDNLSSISPQVQQIWWEQDHLRFRFFWYDMITADEQTLLLNGEWAMFNTPTKDYSMALAQWWRTLESILKRSIGGELSKLFQQHPEWAEVDKINLTKEQQNDEKIFLTTLQDSNKVQKMTLGDLLLVLKKCTSEKQKSKNNACRCRAEASKYLSKFNEQIQPLVKDNWLHPIYLTTEALNLFRNRASHDALLNSSEAAIGRTIALLILKGFFSPVLKNWGFEPKIII